MSQQIIDDFNKLYYSKMGPFNVTWYGIPTQKCPMDLVVFQEIVNEIRPDWIIETGTNQGGSAFYLASLCKLRNEGKVISIDNQQRYVPSHERIQYLFGDSKAPEFSGYLKTIIKPTDRVIVILDSDHTKDHVLAELRSLSQFVSLDSYLIVEDTNINGHPVLPDHGPGPYEAVEEFLKETDEFVVDKNREKFMVTFNPNGYLRRVSVKTKTNEIQGGTL